MIYLYTGENDFAIAEKLEAVKAAFGRKYGDLATEKVDAAEVSAEDLVAKMVNIDMFSPRKLLVVTGAARKVRTWEKVADALVRVPGQTEIVLIESKVDGRLAATRKVKSLAKWTEFKSMRSWELVKWAQELAEGCGAKCSPSVAEDLVMRCGENQWRVKSEIERLVGLGGGLDSELIERYVESEGGGDVFKLVEAVFSGERDRLTAELGKIKGKESAEMFLGLLGGQLLALAALKTAEGRSMSEVAKEVGVHPFVLEKLKSVAERTSERDLAMVMADLAMVDEKVKLGGDGWRLIGVVLNKVQDKFCGGGE